MTKQRYYLFLLFLTLFGRPDKSLGQTDSIRYSPFGAFLIMPIEFPVIDTKSFNQEIINNGFPSSNYSAASLGIGFQIFTNKTIVSFSFNKSTKIHEQKTYITELEYRSTSFSVGYSLTKSNWYSIYPFIGFKGCGLNYLFKEKIDSATTFNKYFQTNLKYKEVTNSLAHLDLGAGFSVQAFYTVLNFRFGYLIPIEAIRWNINNNKTSLSDSPTVNYNCYFSLAIGFGAQTENKKSKLTK